MPKLTVKSQDVETVNGTARRTGRPYTMRKQTAFWQRGDEVRKIEIMLNAEQSPYAPGIYEIDESSFVVDNFGNLGIGRLTLTPFGVARRVA